MPANFTDEQRQAIREKLMVVGYEPIREIGSWTAGATGADVKNNRKAYLGAGDPIYSVAENRDIFIADVFETNIDMIFDCIYHYAAAQK